MFALQLFGDGLEIEIEVLGDEDADLGVFRVADEAGSVFGGGGVHVDVDSCVRKMKLVSMYHGGL